MSLITKKIQLWDCDICGKRVHEATDANYPEAMRKIHMRGRNEFDYSSRGSSYACNHTGLDVCDDCQSRPISDLILAFEGRGDD